MPMISDLRLVSCNIPGHIDYHSVMENVSWVDCVLWYGLAYLLSPELEFTGMEEEGLPSCAVSEFRQNGWRDMGYGMDGKPDRRYVLAFILY